ncbi:MAG: biopolymer transporter ExbD [Opitutaceae bacterium]|nr:biopolymer transporter ExbD [Opitutaceae bacterium]|tara:strand:+ start:681 stop:1082 length:402 start_codon:yes stop_codon:yes gene_type:complete
MSELYPKRRERPEMNLVPLIDVLVILIFFAFVTMQFRSATTLNITVPKVQTSGKNQFSGKVEIGIDNEGRISLNGRVVEIVKMEELLKEVKEVNPDMPILVKADETSHFGVVTQVWDVCRRLGLNKVVMQTRK